MGDASELDDVVQDTFVAAARGLSGLKEPEKLRGWLVTPTYEVYGTDPQGRRVEAYFHPVSFKMLLSSRRGEVLYKAN